MAVRLSYAPCPSGLTALRTQRRPPCCSLAMNGSKASGSDCKFPVDFCRTLTSPAVSSPENALLEMNKAISELESNPPSQNSGIIRLEVPIQQEIQAIGWLHSQCLLSSCYFSSRNQRSSNGGSDLFYVNNEEFESEKSIVSIAGIGSAVFFQQSSPFAFEDWRCIKRFLSKDCPFIRAYGAIRFDSMKDMSFEWRSFGSYYFVIPQVELDELQGSSMLATNIAWDNTLRWPWGKAIDSLHKTMSKISSNVTKFQGKVSRTNVLSKNHMPDKASWNVAVRKALKMINEGSKGSGILKVVLARSSRIVTDADIDPIALLASLQGEGENAYQFFIRPHNSPAFIGNTPEQLFHRKNLTVFTEAIAGTRARGKTVGEDLQIEHELLLSSKDQLEFSIVRESITRKMELICDEVMIDPKKAILKLPRVQHLYARMSGQLRSADDEFLVLSSFHPSPAVCGYPTEEAKNVIATTEMFDRGMYAGPVGWFGGRESEFAVGIRSALIEKGLGALIYAGAGIVKGAEPSSEWEELELKASQFMKIIDHDRPLSNYVKSDLLDTVNWSRLDIIRAKE